MMRQIKKQAPVFVAIVCLLVGALAVGGYILSNQRFYLPAWVPVLGTDFYEVKAELPDRPGRRARPGPDGEHRRRQGRRGRRRHARGRPRRRDMQIKDKYKPIYKDATILLRPKTGLKDMYLALDPGTEAGRRDPGGRPRARVRTRCPT